MKKSLLLSIIIMFMLVSAIAQNYSVSIDGKIFSDNDTVRVYGDPTLEEFSFSATFHNNSTNGVNIGVIRDQVYVHGGTSNFYKWVETYDTQTDTSKFYLFVPAGSQSPDDYFQGYYVPNNIVGISYVKYTYYNINYPDDRFNIFVEYNTVAFGINDNVFSDYGISDPYPNPASNKIQVNFLSSNIDNLQYSIMNLVGEVVGDGIIFPGLSQYSFDVSNLTPSLYFLVLRSENGRSSAKTFIVH